MPLLLWHEADLLLIILSSEYLQRIWSIKHSIFALFYLSVVDNPLAWGTADFIQDRRNINIYCKLFFHSWKKSYLKLYIPPIYNVFLRLSLEPVFIPRK